MSLRNKSFTLIFKNMTADYSNITTEISQLIDTWENKLRNLSDNTISDKRNKQNRTIKQILGHLIDSASNNHQRMVRLQYNTELTFPDYTQDNDTWIAIQDYQNADWPNLIQFWKFYNLHMIHVIKNIDHAKLDHCWHDYEGTRITLNEMIGGYLFHLNLHLDEIQNLINKK